MFSCNYRIFGRLVQVMGDWLMILIGKERIKVCRVVILGWFIVFGVRVELGVYLFCWIVF